MGNRQHERYNINHPAIAYFKDGVKIDCHIQNFSLGGLFLITSSNNSALNIPPGKVATIRIPTQRDTKAIQVTTVHTSDAGLGVAFVNQEDELLNYLQRVSSTKRPQQQNIAPQEVEIVNWIQSATRRLLKSKYPELVKSARTALFDAANNADSNKTQNILFDAYNALRNHQDEIQHLFLHNINSNFQRFSSGNISDDSIAKSSSLDSEMGLVAKEDFEEWVSVVSLTRNLEPEISSKLHLLENSLSFLAKRYITDEKNPASLYSLLWSFKKALSSLEINLQAKRIIFSSFHSNILGEIDTLYDEINLYLNSQGITQQAQNKNTSKTQKTASTQARARTGKLLTDTLSSILGTTGNKNIPKTKNLRPEHIVPREAVLQSLANISAAGQRPILQKIEEQLSGEMLNGQPGIVDNETRQTIQVTEQLLGSLQQDSFINPEIIGLIDTLKIPLVKEALKDPMLLNDTDHPGHKLLNTIGKLGAYFPTEEQDISRKSNLYQSVEEISRLAEKGAQLDIKQATDHLEKIIDQRKNNLKSNLGVVTHSCEQDEQYRAAKKYVFKNLCSKLTNKEIPLVVEQLLNIGWVGLLVHTISIAGKSHKSAIRLLGVIDLLLDIFNSEQGIRTISKVQNTYLIKIIKGGFSKYPPYADDAKHYIATLDEILESEGNKHSSVANKRVSIKQHDIKRLLDQQTTSQPKNIPSSPIEKTWLDLVDGIKLDDWIVEQRQHGHARILNLAWKNTASTRYVFVDGEGKKRLDTGHHNLATLFKQQQCYLLESGKIPIVERAVDRLLKNTFEQIKGDNNTDELTGLLRRNAFQKKMTELLGFTNDAGDHHIMLELDIDRFSAINDLCGLKGGDKLLQTVSNIISNYIPENTTLAKIGSDEFGVLIKNCSPDEGYHVAETLRRALENLRFTWDEKVTSASSSVGVVHINKDIRSAAEVLYMASSACQQAFDDGGNCTRIYRPTDQDIKKQKRMSLTAPIIEDAIKNDRLSLYAQPISTVFLGDSDEHHYEILLRVKNDDGSWVGPSDFIQAAEKCNRMRSIDRWVINHMFAWLNNHHQEINNTSISINLSAQAMDDESFFAFINNHLDESPFPCNKITFEITETTLVKHIDTARKLVEEVKRKGCKFSLDDFGTGYSSYSYLKDFPVDHVKIDGVFIKDIMTDSSSYAMVKSITEISHHMGKKVVAEFVESEAVLVALRELEVDFAQGYYIGQPVPINNLIQSTL